jgi:hypothetical protein
MWGQVMPVELTLADSYLLVRMHDIVTPADFVAYARDAEAIEAAQPQSLDRVTDLTEVTEIDVHYGDMLQLADRRKSRHYTRPVKSAIIAREPVQVGMARMFQTLGASSQIDVRLVGTLEEALEWLRSEGPARVEA